jgi:tryptophan synthase alpha chain
MDRITAAFDRARSENRACFIAYLCAGDPNFDASLECCRAVIEAGTDILELGVPFSDPLADGTTNQLAAQRALESGMTSQRVLELVKKIRTFSEVPIVFYTYYNLVFANGIESAVQRAKDAGVDGILTLDLPPEESDEMSSVCKQAGMKTVFIIAPTTSDRRLNLISKTATGFLYYVSREGVTGVQEKLSSNIGEAVNRIKKATSIPVVVGFGISKREQVREVAASADGVVVGSALVNCISRNLTNPPAAASELGTTVTDLVQGLTRG